ncbi:MAG: 50S ribosomal protein L32 [Candidatus Coatesbacteria bacterium]|nr:MAG: 50S ribosomal protein L32 [Candidatus Coatesbacteria bacterium]
MAVPKRKTSKTRRNKRRTHYKVHGERPVVCPNCGEVRLPYRYCPACGYYDGREVVKPKEE